VKGSLVASFLGVDLLLALTPGADWAYVIAAGVRERVVVPAVAGVVSGYAVHTGLVVAGLAVLVAASPGILTALTAVGAAYLVWLGASVLAHPEQSGSAAARPPVSPARVALRGAATSGLNPKGLLLYLALLPQFIDRTGHWPVAAQAAVLGTAHMAMCSVIYLGVGLLARSVLAARPPAALLITRISGVAMIVLGGLLVLERVLAG
jgi:threonine/homoserine/homoserine lactone efflux protein